MSPEPPAHPVPLMCVRLNPRILVAEYKYPPGAAVRYAFPRLVSGLNENIPNGTTAPGNTSPRFDVPINGSTCSVGSAELLVIRLLPTTSGARSAWAAGSGGVAVVGWARAEGGAGLGTAWADAVNPRATVTVAASTTEVRRRAARGMEFPTFDVGTGRRDIVVSNKYPCPGPLVQSPAEFRNSAQ